MGERIDLNVTKNVPDAILKRLVNSVEREVMIWPLEDLGQKSWQTRLVVGLIDLIKARYSNWLVIRNEAYGNPELSMLLNSWNIKHIYYIWGRLEKRGRLVHGIEQSILVCDGRLLSENQIATIVSNFWFGAGNGFVFTFGGATQPLESLSSLKQLELNQDVISILAELGIRLDGLVVQSDDSETLCMIVNPDLEKELQDYISSFMKSEGLHVAT